MTCRRKFSRQNQPRSAQVRDWVSCSWRLGLALLCLQLTCSTVSAQWPTTNGQSVTFIDEGSRIGFVSHNQEQPFVQFDPGSETDFEEPSDSFVLWDHGSGNCCGDCPPAWRVRADGLLLNYEGGGATLSHAFFLGDFNYEEGGRVSLTHHRDCLDAWELAYIGPYEWSAFGQATGVGLGSRLASTTVNLSEFNNATFHSQDYRTQLHSTEINRRWYGWDVISTLAGVRYINVDEDFLFNSTGPVSTGSLSIETNNHMVGPQIGLDLKFPLGNWMATTSAKGVLMANIADGNVRLVNAGTVQVANGDDDLDLATLIELGYYFSYQITPRVRLRGGYEFWWLYGVANAPSQIPNPITAQTGSVVEEDDIYYHGATVGVEIVW